MDPSAAYIEIQSGSGGTEAQDWAEMLLRMYTKWAENKNFSVEIIEVSHGDVAGIKSATVFNLLFFRLANFFSPIPLTKLSSISSKYLKLLSTTIKHYLKSFKMKVPTN